MGGEQHWRLQRTVNPSSSDTTGFDSLTTHHIEAYYRTVKLRKQMSSVFQYGITTPEEWPRGLRH